MKQLKRLPKLLAIASLSFLAACGSNNNPVPAQIAQGNINNLPPQTWGGNGQCIPLSGFQIGFAGQGVYVDWINVVGGFVPNSGQSVGQMWVGQNGFIGAQAGGFGGQPLQRQSPDGSIYMTATAGGNYFGGFPGATPYAGYPQQFAPNHPQFGNYQAYNPGAAGYGYGVNVSGTVTVSQNVLAEVSQYYGLGSGFGYGWGNPYGNFQNFNNQFGAGGFNTGLQFPQAYYGGGPCVSGIGMNLSHWNDILYNGYVYLYLNHTSSGVQLYF